MHLLFKPATMRKYQLRKWPFLMVLFTGFTCPAEMPEAVVLGETNPKVPVQRKQEKQTLKKSAAHRQETYFFGPQLLLLMP
jgi:hypothetical protein